MSQTSAARALAPRKEVQVVLPGRDELRLSFELRGEIIDSVHLQAIGCPELLELVQQWRPRLSGSVRDLPLPEGDGHAVLMLRELILQARGEWSLPYDEDELCHCRAVPTAKVDAAIVGGAHTVKAVSQRTSAGTSCGACKRDIDSLLAYRLKHAAKA